MNSGSARGAPATAGFGRGASGQKGAVASRGRGGRPVGAWGFA